MRSFIAIDFDVSLKKMIADLQKDIRAKTESGRWKYIDNFHLTLKFIGDINAVDADLIGRRLDIICGELRSFSLEISHIGSFPQFSRHNRNNGTVSDMGMIRVLWLGFSGSVKLLYDLQKYIEDDLESIGFRKENKIFRPHMTIGQDITLKGDFTDLEEAFSNKAFSIINVDSIILFKSEQINRKRVYTPYSSHKLGNTV